MKIGIDIDDTLTDTYCKVLEYVAKEENINLEELKSKNYDYDDLYNGKDYPPMSELIWNNFYRIVPNIEPKSEVSEILYKIMRDGHEIILITARSHVKQEQTIEHLRKYDIPYNKIFDCIDDKGKLAKDENIELFIDDSINNCRQVFSNNIKVFLFDAPYNRKCNDFPRVCSWKEVYEKINEMF